MTDTVQCLELAQGSLLILAGLCTQEGLEPLELPYSEPALVRLVQSLVRLLSDGQPTASVVASFLRLCWLAPLSLPLMSLLDPHDAFLPLLIDLQIDSAETACSFIVALLAILRARPDAEVSQQLVTLVDRLSRTVRGQPDLSAAVVENLLEQLRHQREHLLACWQIILRLTDATSVTPLLASSLLATFHLPLPPLRALLVAALQTWRKVPAFNAQNDRAKRRRTDVLDSLIDDVFLHLLSALAHSSPGPDLASTLWRVEMCVRVLGPKLGEASVALGDWLSLVTNRIGPRPLADLRAGFHAVVVSIGEAVLEQRLREFDYLPSLKAAWAWSSGPEEQADLLAGVASEGTGSPEEAVWKIACMAGALDARSPHLQSRAIEVLPSFLHFLSPHDHQPTPLYTQIPTIMVRLLNSGSPPVLDALARRLPAILCLLDNAATCELVETDYVCANCRSIGLYNKSESWRMLVPLLDPHTESLCLLMLKNLPRLIRHIPLQPDHLLASFQSPSEAVTTALLEALENIFANLQPHKHFPITRLAACRSYVKTLAALPLNTARARLLAFLASTGDAANAWDPQRNEHNGLLPEVLAAFFRAFLHKETCSVADIGLHALARSSRLTVVELLAKDAERHIDWFLSEIEAGRQVPVEHLSRSLFHQPLARLLQSHSDSLMVAISRAGKREPRFAFVTQYLGRDAAAGLLSGETQVHCLFDAAMESGEALDRTITFLQRQLPGKSQGQFLTMGGFRNRVIASLGSPTQHEAAVAVLEQIALSEKLPNVGALIEKHYFAAMFVIDTLLHSSDQASFTSAVRTLTQMLTLAPSLPDKFWLKLLPALRHAIGRSPEGHEDIVQFFLLFIGLVSTQVMLRHNLVLLIYAHFAPCVAAFQGWPKVLAKLREKDPKELGKQLNLLPPATQDDPHKIDLAFAGGLLTNETPEVRQLAGEAVYRRLVHERVSDVTRTNLLNQLHLAIQRYKTACPSIYAGCVGALSLGDNAFKLSEPADTLLAFEQPEFVATLLQQQLEPLLLNPRTHNQAALAIQTIVKGMEPSRWTKLHEDLRLRLEPYRQANYQLTEAARPVEQANPFSLGPISSYSEWLAGVVGELIRRATGRNAAVYAACAPITHRSLHQVSTRLAEFLLPYLCLDVVRYESADQQLWLQLGFMAVLREPPASLHDTEKLRLLCFTKIFDILDWLSQCSAAPPTRLDGKTAQMISNFVSSAGVLKNDVLSRSAQAIHDHMRALYHFELHLREEAKSLVPAVPLPPLDAGLLDTLHQLYTGLEDTDSLNGVSALKRSLPGMVPEFEHFANEATALNQSFEALALHLQAPRPPPVLALWQQLRQLCLPSLQDWFVKSLADRPDPIDPNIVRSLRIESSWRLGNWSQLEELVKPLPPDPSFETLLGGLILGVRQQSPEFEQMLDRVRTELIHGISASRHSEAETYSWLVKFHAVEDIAMAQTYAPVSLPKLWAARMRGTRQGLKHVDLLATVHRSLALALGPSAGAAIPKSWLVQAQVARSSGHLQVAYNCLAPLLGRGLVQTDVVLEYARVLKSRGQAQQALAELSRSFGLEEAASLSTQHTRGPSAHYMIGKLQSELGHSAKEVQDSLAAALLAGDDSAKGMAWNGKVYLRLAKFYDRLLMESRDSRVINVAALGHSHMRYEEKNSDSERTKWLTKALDNYARATESAPKSAPFVLPRFLTLWCDIGRPGSALAAFSILPAMEEAFSHLAVLSAHLWLSVVPQLCSRVAFLDGPQLACVEAVLLRLLIDFPSESAWLLYFYYQTKKGAGRKKGVLKVWEQARDPATKTSQPRSNHPAPRVQPDARVHILSQLEQIVNGLKELAVAERAFKIDSRTLPQFFKVLRLQTECAIPYEANLYYLHPPRSSVMIVGLAEELEPQASLRAPKKFHFIGSDGQRYAALAKRGDDLRKDGRVQDFFRLVNLLLRSDSECRSRGLVIRTYSATPLTDQAESDRDAETGVLEFVPDSKGFRFLVADCYSRQSTDFFNASDVERQYAEPSRDRRGPTTWKRQWRQPLDRYEDILQRIGPPMWHRWFQATFRSPGEWYAARKRYTSSVAVTSILGAVMGIGDRHCENIMINVATAEVVHIDFNVLFWKGLSLTVPEEVPFRLTPNIIDGFGVTGTEGAFRAVSQLTVALLRRHQATLLTILETFVYDPFSDIPKTDRISSGDKRRRTSAPAPPVEPSAEAERILKRVQNHIEGRLDGSTPLSLENHVSFFIEQARDKALLSRIYKGWLAWI